MLQPPMVVAARPVCCCAADKSTPTKSTIFRGPAPRARYVKTKQAKDATEGEMDGPSGRPIGQGNWKNIQVPMDMQIQQKFQLKHVCCHARVRVNF